MREMRPLLSELDSRACTEAMCCNAAEEAPAPSGDDDEGDGKTVLANVESGCSKAFSPFPPPLAPPRGAAGTPDPPPPPPSHVRFLPLLLLLLLPASPQSRPPIPMPIVPDRAQNGPEPPDSSPLPPARLGDEFPAGHAAGGFRLARSSSRAASWSSPLTAPASARALARAAADRASEARRPAAFSSSVRTLPARATVPSRSRRSSSSRRELSSSSLLLAAAAAAASSAVATRPRLLLVDGRLLAFECSGCGWAPAAAVDAAAGEYSARSTAWITAPIAADTRAGKGGGGEGGGGGGGCATAGMDEAFSSVRGDTAAHGAPEVPSLWTAPRASPSLAPRQSIHAIRQGARWTLLPDVASPPP